MTDWSPGDKRTDSVKSHLPQGLVSEVRDYPPEPLGTSHPSRRLAEPSAEVPVKGRLTGPQA